MNCKEFIELNPPIGTKVRYKDKEWLFVGFGMFTNKSGTIQLSRNDDNDSFPKSNYIDEYDDREIEIIGIPTFKTLPKYKVGDIVYWKYLKCIILEDRDEEENKYFVYNTVLHQTKYYQEQELLLEPQDQNDEQETVEVKNISDRDLKDGEVVNENEVKKLEVKGDTENEDTE